MIARSLSLGSTTSPDGWVRMGTGRLVLAVRGRPQSVFREGNRKCGLFVVPGLRKHGNDYFMGENFVPQSENKKLGICFSSIKNISYVLYKTVDCTVKALYTAVVGRRKSCSLSLLLGFLASP